jgi:uncharacterized protein YjbI with pentapeptide repeats
MDMNAQTTITIYNRFTNEAIFTAIASNMRKSVMAALHSGAKLIGADLRDADLRGADLRGADLDSADMRDANMHGANLYGRKPIHCDKVRHYVIYVLPEAKGGPRFIAGCRSFTHMEAIAHWGESQPAYVKAINDYMNSTAGE